MTSGWEAPISATLQGATTSFYYKVLSVRQGSCLNAAATIGCATIFSGNVNLYVPSAPAGTYYFIVDDQYTFDSGAFTLTVR